MTDPNLYLPYDQVGPLASFGSVVGFGVFGLLAVMGVAAGLEYTNRKRAASARAALRKGSLDRAGYVGVRGRVEVDGASGELSEGDNAVASVEIAQFGTPSSHNGMAQQVWTEFSRKAKSRPFYVVTEQGDRVRVEPDERFVLTDASFASTKRLNRYTRERRAELRPGDEVYVLGEAVEGFDPSGANEGAGYRGGARGFVLRAPKRDPLVISRERPEDRHARREGFHGRWALAAAVAMLFLQLGLFSQYHFLAFTGRVIWGQEAWASDSYTRTTKLERLLPRALRAPATQYSVHAHFPTVTGDLALHARTSLQVYEGVNAGLSRVPFLVSTRAPNLQQIGRDPVVSRGSAGFAVLAVSLLAIAYAAHTRKTRPWYDRGRRVDREFGVL